MCIRGDTRGERGQASPEWVGLVLLVAALVVAALSFLGSLTSALLLAQSLGEKLVCAARIGGGCERDSELAGAYGAALAHEVRAHAPALVYERGMEALPVDYRRCRAASCAEAGPSGRVWRSRSGEPATAFVHVVDCRRHRVESLALLAERPDCSGPRRGFLYVQYWFYYPDSATLRGVPVAGSKGFHDDDWESAQVRIGPGGRAEMRASAHRAYDSSRGPQNWGAEAGIGPLGVGAEKLGLRSHGGWDAETGVIFISGGSHAGSTRATLLDYARMTPTHRLALVPLETLGPGERPSFAIAPPWRKRVWSDPEDDGTS